jgi:hypothetical protein
MTIESALLSIRTNMLVGGARLDLSNRRDYGELEALEAFNRMKREHGWHWTKIDADADDRVTAAHPDRYLQIMIPCFLHPCGIAKPQQTKPQQTHTLTHYH